MYGNQIVLCMFETQTGGHLDVVQLLVHAGADIDSQDNRKVSCLMAAFRKVSLHNNWYYLSMCDFMG